MSPLHQGLKDSHHGKLSFHNTKAIYLTDVRWWVSVRVVCSINTLSLAGSRKSTRPAWPSSVDPHRRPQTQRQHENSGADLWSIKCWSTLVSGGLKAWDQDCEQENHKADVVTWSDETRFASPPWISCLDMAERRQDTSVSQLERRAGRLRVGLQGWTVGKEGGDGLRERKEGRKEPDLWLCDKEKPHPSSSGFRGFR